MLSSLFFRAAHYIPALSFQFNSAALCIEQHEKKHVLMKEFRREMREGRFDLDDACYRIAQTVHARQTRNNGEPYMKHIDAVMRAPEHNIRIDYTPNQRRLASVHDVPEDSFGAWKPKHFKKLGADDEFIQGLHGMTKRKGEKYFDYIERCSQTIAIDVKIGDNEHNWLDSPKPMASDKYRVSIHYLLAVKNGLIEAGSSIVEFAKEHGFYNRELFARYSSHPPIEDYVPPSHKSHMSRIPPSSVNQLSRI